jgi:hypothetical protein
VARVTVPARTIACTALCSFMVGCGGGAPLLHGAHPLRPGLTSYGVGASGTFTTGAARNAVESAREQLPSSTNRNANDAKAAAVGAAMAPSVAPWVGARIGVPGDNEAGLSFTGRALRLDARHVFESGSIAFSVGAGGNVVWRNADPVSEGSSTSFRVRSGYGFDVPLLIGWRSDAGVVSVWGGARGGLETIGATMTGAGSPMILLTDVDFLRRYVGGVAGLTMGFRHVHVALELNVLYQAVSGTVLDVDVRLDGVTLSPAGGLVFTF